MKNVFPILLLTIFLSLFGSTAKVLAGENTSKHNWEIQNFNDAVNFDLTLYSKNKEILLSGEEQDDIIGAVLDFWNRFTFDTDKAVLTSADGNWKATLLREGITPYLKLESTLDERVLYHFMGKKPGSFKVKKLLRYDINPEMVEHKKLFDQIGILYSENKAALQKAVETTNYPLAIDGKWEYESKETLESIMELYRKLLKKWDEVRKQNSKMSDLEFQQKMVTTNKVVVKEAGVGVAELNAIDGRPFVRVVQEKTELVFLIADENDLVMSSNHLKTYLARQHVDAGAAREDGKSGRDVVLLMLDNLSPDGKISFSNSNNFDLYKTHRSILKMNYWRDWWAATYKTPTMANLKFGAICGIFQGVLGACIAGASYAINPEAGFNIAPPILSTVWGTLIGTYISFYKNWTNRGGMYARTLKSSANSLAFGYALKFLIGASMGDWTTHLYIALNVIAKNRAKQEWNNFPRFREFSGLTKKPYEFKLPGGKVISDKSISQASVENQAWYTFPYIFSYLDLIDFEILGFPLGKATLIANIPLVNYAFLQYIEHVAVTTGSQKAIEMAHDHRIRFERTKLFFTSSKVRGLISKKLVARLTGMKKLVTQYGDELNNIYERSYEKVMETKIDEYEKKLKEKELKEKELKEKKLQEGKPKEGIKATIMNVIDTCSKYLKKGDNNGMTPGTNP